MLQCQESLEELSSVKRSNFVSITESSMNLSFIWFYMLIRVILQTSKRQKDVTGYGDHYICP